MTQPEYDQQKRECWEEFKVLNSTTLETTKQAFDWIWDRAYSLGKQENDADTVIQGWVCRDKKDSALNLHAEKPYRTQSGYDVGDEPDWWESDCASFLPLNKELFPDLTWDDDPIEVEIIIKRKKK